MPLCEPVSFATAKSCLTIGANFQIFIGKVKGIYGSLAADGRPVTWPFYRPEGLVCEFPEDGDHC